jgi:hypothetical protein
MIASSLWPILPLTIGLVAGVGRMEEVGTVSATSYGKRPQPPLDVCFMTFSHRAGQACPGLLTLPLAHTARPASYAGPAPTPLIGGVVEPLSAHTGVSEASPSHAGKARPSWALIGESGLADFSGSALAGGPTMGREGKRKVLSHLRPKPRLAASPKHGSACDACEKTLSRLDCITRQGD